MQSDRGDTMSEASERTFLLLQEMALLKEEKKSKSVKARQRRKQICEEIKRIAAEKKHAPG